jgi:hypothetical protein
MRGDHSVLLCVVCFISELLILFVVDVLIIIVIIIYNTKLCPLQKNECKKKYSVVPSRQSYSQPLDIHQMMEKVQKADVVCCRLYHVMVLRVMHA